jgi:hypothetical protein
LIEDIRLIIRLSPSFLSPIICQISSVMKGMKGWISLARLSDIEMVASYVSQSTGFHIQVYYLGTILKNSSQNSL